MAEILFTRAEADALLPRLRPLLGEARELAAALAGGETAQAIRAVSGGNGGGNAARRLGDLAAGLQRIVEEVGALGVILRDPSTGLIDFPATRDGAEIFLCWRFGEDAVGWWHERATGFAGRRRIDW